MTFKFFFKCSTREKWLVDNNELIKAETEMFSLKMVFIFSLNTLYNRWKNNLKAYRMINFNICFMLYVFKLVNGMVLYERLTTHLDHLLQKSLRYQHHRQNYIQSIHEGIISNGLQLNKKPVFEWVSSNFNDKWRTILYQAKEN